MGSELRERGLSLIVGPRVIHRRRGEPEGSNSPQRTVNNCAAAQNALGNNSVLPALSAPVTQRWEDGEPPLEELPAVFGWLRIEGQKSFTVAAFAPRFSGID